MNTSRTLARSALAVLALTLSSAPATAREVWGARGTRTPVQPTVQVQVPIQIPAPVLSLQHVPASVLASPLQLVQALQERPTSSLRHRDRRGRDSRRLQQWSRRYPAEALWIRQHPREAAWVAVNPVLASWALSQRLAVSACLPPEPSRKHHGPH